MMIAISLRAKLFDNDTVIAIYSKDDYNSNHSKFEK